MALLLSRERSSVFARDAIMRRRTKPDELLEIVDVLHPSATGAPRSAASRW
jgi:hypothetical protein